MSTSEMMVLGFDVRGDNSGQWDQTRREKFLLLLDVKQPFAADSAVWPSLLSNSLRPDTCIAHQDLWNDLGQLSSLCPTEAVASGQSRFVAITIELDVLDSDERTFWEHEVQ